MGLTAKAKSSREGWGMGFLFVFFPEDDADADAIVNKKSSNNIFSSVSSSSSSSSSPSCSAPFRPINAFLKRTNSTHLLTRAQSTISICALLIFITLLLFTLSTFEPTTPNIISPRRQLYSKPVKKNSPPWQIRFPNRKFRFESETVTVNSPPLSALQGMGTLNRRGTRGVNDLIIAHVIDSVTANELRVFIRLFQRSPLASRSDLVFILPPAPTPTPFDDVIREENDSFMKLVDRYNQPNRTNSNSPESFVATQFAKSSKKERETGEPIWGQRSRSNSSEEDDTESTRLSYGSMVSFDADELDPEKSLSGFLDHVSMNFRRWACYPMLLGRIRRNFKHVILVDVKDVLIVGDPLSRVRTRSPESVHLSTAVHSKHGRKDKTRQANPAIVTGGIRGVRRLSAAMLTEIARAAMQHKRKNSLTESGLFNQLVGNEYILKNVNIDPSVNSLPEMSSLTELNPNSVSPKFTAVIRGKSNNIDAIMKHICDLLSTDSSVYSDC